ncbi:synaptogyrin-like [Limulus polyphemus]|uniref:Synaptogyrin n=1 Tax=Limulus polyphemus TaxID=6850 RepID=A0ABM1BHW2_LIMPO|nr:synaptogyrin-like [Limulus polyphemus]
MEGYYGGVKPRESFDPLSFIKKPQVILRLLCWIFAVVVFGCISDEGWLNDKCIFNGDNHACNYGIGIGVIAFLASIVFLVVEARFEIISSIKLRKQLVLCDLVFSGFWSFLYFIGFCYLCDAWHKSDNPIGGFGVGNAKAAIAFSFFSIISWAGCAFLAFRRCYWNADTSFGTGYDSDPNAEAVRGPYNSYPDGPDMNEAYEEPPFSQLPQESKVNVGGPTFQASSY